MCGLAGIYYDDGQARPDMNVVKRMVRALNHRGPDGQGFLDRPGIGLGHARLGIIDLAGGAQPIANADESIWIVYNGEVFNYPELREGLIARKHSFRTSTDTEVLVHLYEEFGDDFIERLNGQFAFALWDGIRQRLLLARDRAGILPLYWCRVRGCATHGPGIAFGSEIKALLATKLVDAEPDPDGIDELWTFWGTVAPRTVFRGIEQLRPGEMVILQPGKVTRRQYWSWQYPIDGQHRRGRLPELKDELGDLLTDATHIRLRADVPVGAYLSGGLDSSSLVALLSNSVARSLHTFSIGFEDPGLDESVHQRVVVEHLKTRHHQLPCSKTDIAATFPAAIRHAESPVLRSAPAPMRLLSQSVRKAGIKVVLTGEGADEVLGGYDIFKEAKVRRFWAQEPGSRCRPLLLNRLYPYLDLAGSKGDAHLRQFFGQGISTPDHPFFSHQPRWATTAQCKMFWRREFAERVSSNAQDRLLASLPGDFDRWHAFNRAEYLEATVLLPGYLLSSQGDRMLMANSVEGRFPYLDHRLIRFANFLHPTVKMRVLEEKHLLREAMRKMLPQSILHRVKQPYRAPDAAAFVGGNSPDYVNELLSPEKLERYGYFEASKVGRLLAKLRSGNVSSTRDNMAFLGILSTQLWHHEFMKQ